jgi:mannose-6-phosphate isomerase-like protein (cupin superfamily)
MNGDPGPRQPGTPARTGYPRTRPAADREDECSFVLDGELSVRCGDSAFDAAAGSFIFLPRGRPHRFWAAARRARLLLIAVPGGIEDYFRQINTATTDGERHQIGERYGIRVVPR